MGYRNEIRFRMTPGQALCHASQFINSTRSRLSASLCSIRLQPSRLHQAGQDGITGATTMSFLWR